MEIGDIAQLKNLNSLKITERVPLSEIADCKPLKDYYTEGELASMVVEAIQSGDNSEETKAEIQAAGLVNQSNDEYSHAIMDDFHTRAWGKGLNYHYSPDHHLYDGGPKTKCKNNIEAIRLLKELQAQGRIATAEEQITLARFVGWGGLAGALTPEKSGWEKEYAEIRELLTDEEFQAAQKSTLTSYYTEQSVISHIYKGMNMFLMIADIKTADMLDLPTPKLKTGAVQVIKTEITPEQKRIVMELAERAEKIRNGEVDSSEDNFLKLTLEARLLSTDPRAIDPDLPDDPNTKLNVCARKTAEIYHAFLAGQPFCERTERASQFAVGFKGTQRPVLKRKAT